MKTKIVQSAKMLLLGLVFSNFNHFSAQNLQVTEFTADTLSTCLGDYVFSLKIKNNSSQNASDFSIMIDLPDGINYTGNLTNALEQNVTDLNYPFFTEQNPIPAGDSVIITYTVQALCASITNSLITNAITIAYSLDNVPQTNLIVNADSYNLLYADLSITNLNSLNALSLDLNIGDHVFYGNPTYWRAIQIHNGGFGSIDTVIVRVTPEPEIQYNLPTPFLARDGITPIPFTIDPLTGEYVLTIYGSNLYGASDLTGLNDSLFDYGENLLIIEDFTVLSCTSGVTDYKVEWGCGAQVCNKAKSNAASQSSVYVNTGYPYIEPQLPEGSFHGKGQKGLLNFCGKDTTLTFWFINKGANDPNNTILNPGDFATDVKMHITHNMSDVVFSAFEINGVSMNLIPDSVFYHANNVQTCFPATHNNNMAGYVIDLSKNINPNLGIPDLDRDGYYDDIPDSDTVKVRLRFHLSNIDPYVSCDQNVYGQIEPSVCWNNNCGTNRREADGWYNQYAYGHLYYWHKISKDQGDIVEPIDFVEDSTEVFRFCVGNKEQDLRIFNCPVDSFYAVVQLPPGYGLNFGVLPNFSDSALFVDKNGASIRVSAQQIDQEIFIQGVGGASQQGNTLNWIGCYEVPILLDCDLAPDGIPGITPISWELRYVCDTCSTEQVKACYTQNVYNHTNCNAGDGCDGISTQKPTVQRASFGWTDHTMTQLANATIPGIKLKAAYVYDTVKAYLPGFVNSTALMSQGFATLSYNYVGSTPFFSVLGGTFKSYDANGNFTGISCAASNLTETTTGGTHNIQYEIPSACLSSLNMGDKIVLELDMFTRVNVADAGLNTYEIPNLRTYYTTIINDIRNQCDNWGDRFTLYGVRATTEVQTGGIGCEKTKIGLYTYFRSGTNGNDFPNEFRPLVQTNGPLTFTIPAGYSYEGVPGTAFYYPEGNISTPVSTSSVSGVQTGNTITFNINTLPFVDKFSIHEGAKIFEFELQPTCERNDTLASRLEYNYDGYYYTKNPSYYQNVEWWAHRQNHPNDTVNVLQYNYKPNLKLTVLGNVEQQAYTKAVFWDIKICNETDNAHPKIGVANNVWMDIDNAFGNVGNISIENITQINPFSSVTFTNYNSDESALAEMNTISVNSCKTYRIFASYKNCQEDKVDTLRLLNGWTCDDYPTPQGAEDSVCHANEQLLFLRYKTANLQLKDFPKTGPNEICDVLNYEFALNSSGLAYMHNVNFWLNLPTGTSLVNPQFLYPENSTSWLDLNTYANPGNFPGSNSIGWDLNPIFDNDAFDYGISSEFESNRYPNLNEIRIRFDLKMDCAFNPADSLLVNSSGITNCNDSITRRNVYHINIQGFENLVEYDLSHLDIDSLNCGEENTLSFTVKNLSAQNNTLGDSLRIQLPAGFVFVSGTGTPSQPVENGGELTFDLGFIAANGSKTFTFQIESTTVFTCTPIAINAEIFRTVATTCTIDCESITARWSDVLNTIYCCDPCYVDAEFIVDTICVGEQLCFKIADKTMADSSRYTHLWLFGDGASSNEVEPCHVYAQVGTYTVTHTVVNFIDNCEETLIHEVEVLEEPHGSIVLLGCNPFCEGDTVYLTVNGHYKTIEWFNMTNNTSLGSFDTLAVTTSGTYTAVLGNGFCVDSCLSITLSTQALPEIEIPDTMVCDSSDLVTLDAGPGFTSYLWNTGDTTRQITVGPGIYWVEVGEKLPFGCCTCKGRDTVVVSVSDLEVELRDTVLCFGQSVTLTPRVTGGTPPYTYLWNTLETTPSIVVTNAGQYWVQVTDAAKCTDSDTANVRFDYPPNPEFTYDDTICINYTSCYVAVDTGIDKWHIYNSNAVLIASFGDTNQICYRYPAVGTYTIEHILSNACGSDTARHTIVVVPPVEACIVMIGQNPFCIGDEVCLTINDPFKQVTSVDWYLDSVFVGSMDTLCVTEPGTYRAMIEDANGCTNACMCIVLTQAPQAVVNLPETVTVCNGAATTITAPVGFKQYVWTKDGSFYNYGDNEISVTQAGRYILTVMDANACETSDTTIVNVLPKNMNITSSKTLVCRGESFKVFTSYNPNFNYSWDFKKTDDSLWTTIPGSDTSYLSLSGDMMSQAGGYWFRVRVYDPVSGCTSTGKVMIIHQLINCSEISLIPNPASGNSTSVYYNLMGAGVQKAHIELRDTRGNMVKRINVNPEEQLLELDIRNYASGVYQVYLFADGEFISLARLVIAK